MRLGVGVGRFGNQKAGTSSGAMSGFGMAFPFGKVQGQARIPAKAASQGVEAGPTLG
jgi:hypothetical protein